ncbi:hypothetical protein ACYPJF_21120, partial [Stenotrophomonas geniculata]
MTEILSAIDLLHAPAILIDESLTVFGANTAAHALLPSLEAQSSLAALVAEDDQDKLFNLLILSPDVPGCPAGLDIELGPVQGERKWRNLQAKQVTGFASLFVVTLLDIHAAK